jgi:Kef-type K+ transport system membrane component KefB
MFASGAETHGQFRTGDRRQILWLTIIGTGLPFVSALVAAPLLPLDLIMGTANAYLPLLLVVAIAVAVTSIPVISKIFHDLGILTTRFAQLVLGVAVLEDLVLWCVLAVATALVTAKGDPSASIALHLLWSVLYFGLGLTIVPQVLERITVSRWNVLRRVSPIAYTVVILLGYVALAALMDVNLVFAAFLAGFALRRDIYLAEARQSLSAVAFGVFIPIYFAIVGLQLQLTRSFSFSLLIGFLVVTSIVKVLSAGLGARLAGFAWSESVNLAVSLNARGGPGIVVATVAYDAGIINAQFYTTLVIVAVVTSQMAGVWLAHVLRRDQPLLKE